MICDQWVVVAVPFPFTDHPGTKKRPALVVSNSAFNQQGHTILAMITTKEHRNWPGDHKIIDIAAAGLHVPCLVRCKLFTLDNRLIIKSLGSLAKKDRSQVQHNLQTILSC